MKTLRILLVFALMSLLSSCAPILSLHPWYSENELVLEPALAGDWYSVDDNGKVDTSNKLRFTQDLEKGYTLTLADNDHPGYKETFAIYLFRLNGQLFVDQSQGASYFNSDTLDEGILRIAGHMVGRISIQPDNVRMDFLDDDWVKDALKSNPNLVRNERVGDNIFLTASEAELRQFLLNATRNDKAMSFTIKLKRASASAPPSKQ